MLSTWRFEVYNRNSKRLLVREQQTYGQVWLAATDCAEHETLKFGPPSGAGASEISALLELGAVRSC